MKTDKVRGRSSRSFLFLPVAMSVLAALARPAPAQRDDGRRIYDEQLRVRLDQQAPEAREIGLDAGGWFNFALFDYDDDAVKVRRTLRQYELRLWGNLNILGAHRFYVRAQTGYNDWNTGDDPLGHNDTYLDPDIERAWYRFDLGRMLRNLTGKQPPVDFAFKVGRDFATIGTALTLSMPLDMVQLDATAGDWQFMALLGKTIRRTRNLDDSDAVSDHQHRCIWGVQARYLGFSDHRPFAYYLSNHDRTRPRPYDPFQAYDYSSRYIGLGCEGIVILPHLRYQTEVVGEMGKTHSWTSLAGRDRICAMAVDALLEYLPQIPLHPRFLVEYLFASGDSDRPFSATATVGGNLPGTKDYAFNAFGFRDTGLAFAPRISNLNMYVVGASLLPLERHELFKRMEIGTKAFFYHKAASSGAMSEPTTINRARWAGWEWDVYCDWRITSDLSWTIRYGAFQPGPACDNRACRHFLYTGVTFSF